MSAQPQHDVTKTCFAHIVTELLQNMTAELHIVAMCCISYETAVTCYAFIKSATINGYGGNGQAT